MQWRYTFTGIFMLALFLVNCTSQERSPMKEHAQTNALIHETSPYLLQHAHNPVNWYPWGEEALKKARKEKKLIIVSIGYSSCHWCHVMEHECFEDSAVAALMNEHFICIKVDREERPDIDHIYMTAVHMMNLRGGWPLNCVALPDGRPFWGSTYFPRDQWMDALNQVRSFYEENPEKTELYAAELADGISRNSLLPVAEGTGDIEETDLHGAISQWTGQFDLEYGGMKGAPKFPMPVNLELLLHYGYQYKDQKILDFVEQTLVKMARGGIYDQAGGGFARYSVDQIWKVPHFEKMLYDNAQLIGLYARGFQVYGHDIFKDVIQQSVEFLKRELTSGEGLFYSALDADSEGEEGKFYVWSKEELEVILEGDFDLFSEYYNINDTGLWEHNRFILYRTSDPGTFADEHGLGPTAFSARVTDWDNNLLEARSVRERPGLDDKSLTSWNSLMISGLVSVYRALGEPGYLEMAAACASTIREKLWSEEKVLYRNYKEGVRTIPGFHIDYALFTEACLDLYEASLDQTWLDLATEVTNATMVKFFQEDAGMFHYNASGTDVLITHHMETQDNVIPSSNGVMAHNLFRLGHLLVNFEYLQLAASMTQRMTGRIEQYPNGFARWASLLIKLREPFYEIAVVGTNAGDLLKQISADYLPHAVLAGTTSPSDLVLFRERFQKDKTRIFVCRDNVCQLPVQDPEDAKAIYSK